MLMRYLTYVFLLGIFTQVLAQNAGGIGKVQDDSKSNTDGNKPGGTSQLLATLLASPAVKGLLQTMPPDIRNMLMSGNMTAIGSLLASPSGQKYLQPILGQLASNPALASLIPGIGKLLGGLTNGSSASNPLSGLSGLISGTTGLQNIMAKVKAATDSLKYWKVSSECVADFQRIAQGVSSKQMWAIQMLDATGKLDSGLLELSGSKKLLGDYDECLGITATGVDRNQSVDYFTGQYCIANIYIPPGKLVPGLQGEVGVGTCVSSRCDSNDIAGIIRTAEYVITNGSIPYWPTVTCKSQDRHFGTDAIAVTCFLIVLGILMLIGTLYDILAVQLDFTCASTSDHVDLELSGIENPSYSEAGPDLATITKGNGIGNGHIQNSATEKQGEKPKQRGIMEQIVLSFSVYTNGVKILNTEQGAGALGAVNGIRFLSMAWVILGHTYFFSNGYDKNLYGHILSKMDEWTFMFIPYATVSVDSFFALSGILVGYLTLRELKKVDGALKFNWFMFYFHRFWRLTPPYMLLLMVGIVLVPFFNNGPMWADGDNPTMTYCRDNWWTNLLYINNYVKSDKMCMGWTWYLANDMQFYIISPLILVPLFYLVYAGLGTGLVIMLGSWIATAVVTAVHHYPVQQILAPGTPNAPHPKDGDYMKNIYFPSYARAGPYIIGLFTGYLLYRFKCKCRIPKIVNLAVWLLCIVVCCVIVYSPYTKGDSHIMSVAESTVYWTLSRTAWGVAVCWIVFACACGYGGWINQLLSWKAFIPLGRLTYCAYLVHPICISVYASSLRVPYYFNDYTLTYLFFGSMVTAYGVAFVASLAFESPMMALEKAAIRPLVVALSRSMCRRGKK